jgi:hypothetical protein
MIGLVVPGGKLGGKVRRYDTGISTARVCKALEGALLGAGNAEVWTIQCRSVSRALLVVLLRIVMIE